MEKVREQVLAMRGNLAAVARAFGVSRQAVWKFVQEHDSLKETAAEARETMLDNAESSLQRAVISGEAWAVCFYLKTQGKARGYVERQEVTGKDGEAVVVRRYVGIDPEEV